jgi:nucleotide-binding universal stress UspA family protein
VFQHILIPVDLDEPSSWTKAMPAAAALAKAFDAQVTAMTVITNRDAQAQAAWSTISYSALVDKTTAQLAEIADRELGRGRAAVRVGSGSVYGAILDAAVDIAADLIVMSSHRPAMREFLIGANAARVARHAKCSVMIVRE